MVEASLGARLKNCRLSQKMTLKELSQETGLSVGYLSLLERDRTSVTLVSIQNIARALQVHPSIFLDLPPLESSNVLRQQEQVAFKVPGDDSAIYYNLNVNVPEDHLEMGPMIKVYLPGAEEEENHRHDNEEFGFVLEGALTLKIEDKQYELYPGDCFHFDSKKPHSLSNHTDKLVKILSVLRQRLEQF